MNKFAFCCLISGILAITTIPAGAASTCTVTTTNPSGNPVAQDPACNDQKTYFLFVNGSLQHSIRTCSSCVEGQHAVLETTSPTNNPSLFAICSNASSLISTYGFKECIVHCDHSSPSDNAYLDYMGCMTANSFPFSPVSYATDAYESKANNTWDDSRCTCNNSTLYRCAAGYYGNPSCNGTTCSGCTSCADGATPLTSSTGASVYPTSLAGSTNKTSCFYPAGTYKDSAGTYTMPMCYYKN